MAATLSINVKGLDKVIKNLKTFGPDVMESAQHIVKAAAQDMVAEAVKRAPKDEGGGGGISSSINMQQQGSDYVVNMQKTHGIYQEFGTKGKFKAPGFLGSYPARFKGKGTGTYQEALTALTGWVKRKGITGTYSVKTKRRTGNKATQEKQNRQAAYLILRKILREGLKPQPYFFPSFLIVRKRMIAEMKQLLKDQVNKR